MNSVSALTPVILLLGAKSLSKPLEAIPRELEQLEQQLTAFQNSAHLCSRFEIRYYPYFTQSQLKKKLNQLANRVAILHFAGHSNSDSFLTDDGTVYSQHIANHIKSWHIPPSLVFLNGCHNVRQVQKFHKSGVTYVIATKRAIDDNLAASFANNFYSALLIHPHKTNVQDAFNRASSNVLMGENRTARSLDLVDDNESAWDWDIFAKEGTQKSQTFNELITVARPVLDENGRLYNPYKGLEAFQENDQLWFFGREHLSEAFSKRIIGKEKPVRFFALMGGSGSGKSSLMSAGVIPKLREHDNGYLILQARPSSEPFEEMANIMSSQLYTKSISRKTFEKQALTKQLGQEAGDPVLPDLVRDVLIAKGGACHHIFLFVDQFEELFTHSTTYEVQNYLRQLIALIASDVACTLMISMRADFLPEALANPEFANQINKNLELLPPMSRGELRSAVERPSQLQHIGLEPSLTETLLQDVENQPGSLPLLQYVLNLLWDEREKLSNNIIRLEDYVLFGGLDKALQQKADSLYDELDARQKQLCQEIFLRLVQLGKGTEDTRRRAEFSEFSNSEELLVIKSLTDARLITTHGETTTSNLRNHTPTQAAYVEISHEALIRTWPKLKEWIAVNRDEMRVQHQLSDGTKAWIDHDRGEDWLLAGTRLEIAADWLDNNSYRATENEKNYVRSSSIKQESIIKEKNTRKKRNKIVTSFFLITITLVTIFSVFQWNNSLKSERNAVSARFLAEERSALLSIDKANKLLKGGENDEALLLLLNSAKSFNKKPPPDSLLISLNEATSNAKLEKKFWFEKDTFWVNSADGLYVFNNKDKTLYLIDNNKELISLSSHNFEIISIGNLSNKNKLTLITKNFDIFYLNTKNQNLSTKGKLEKSANNIKIINEHIFHNDINGNLTVFNSEKNKKITINNPEIEINEIKFNKNKKHFYTETKYGNIFSFNKDFTDLIITDSVEFHCPEKSFSEESYPVDFSKIDGLDGFSCIQHSERATFTQSYIFGSGGMSFNYTLSYKNYYDERKQIDFNEYLNNFSSQDWSSGQIFHHIDFDDEGKKIIASQNNKLVILNSEEVIYDKTLNSIPIDYKFLNNDIVYLAQNVKEKVVFTLIDSNLLNFGKKLIPIKNTDENSSEEEEEIPHISFGACSETHLSYDVEKKEKDYFTFKSTKSGITFKAKENDGGAVQIISKSKKTIDLKIMDYCSQLSHDLRYLLILKGSSIQVYDLGKALTTGNLKKSKVGTIEDDTFARSAFFIENSLKIVTSHFDNRVVVWEINKKTGIYEGKTVLVNEFPVVYAEPSQDGKRLIIVENTGASQLEAFLYSLEANSIWSELGQNYKYLDVSFDSNNLITVFNSNSTYTFKIPSLSELVDEGNKLLSKFCTPTKNNKYDSSRCWPDLKSSN